MNPVILEFIKDYTDKDIPFTFESKYDIRPSDTDNGKLYCLNRGSVTMDYVHVKQRRREDRPEINMIYLPEYTGDRYLEIHNTNLFYNPKNRRLGTQMKEAFGDLKKAAYAYDVIMKNAVEKQDRRLLFDDFGEFWYELVYLSFYGVDNKNPASVEIASRVAHDFLLYFIILKRLDIKRWVSKNVSPLSQEDEDKILSMRLYRHIKVWEYGHTQEAYYIFRHLFLTQVLHLQGRPGNKKERDRFDFITLETIARMPYYAQYNIDRLQNYKTMYTIPNQIVIVLKFDREFTHEFNTCIRLIRKWYNYEKQLWGRKGPFVGIPSSYQPFFNIFKVKYELLQQSNVDLGGFGLGVQIREYIRKNNLGDISNQLKRYAEEAQRYFRGK